MGGGGKDGGRAGDGGVVGMVKELVTQADGEGRKEMRRRDGDGGGVGSSCARSWRSAGGGDG